MSTPTGGGDPMPRTQAHDPLTCHSACCAGRVGTGTISAASPSGAAAPAPTPKLTGPLADLRAYFSDEGLNGIGVMVQAEVVAAIDRVASVYAKIGLASPIESAAPPSEEADALPVSAEEVEGLLKKVDQRLATMYAREDADLLRALATAYRQERAARGEAERQLAEIEKEQVAHIEIIHEQAEREIQQAEAELSASRTQLARAEADLRDAKDICNEATVTFPAYQHLGKHIGRGFARWRIYMHLVHGDEEMPPVLNFVVPVDVKVTGLAVALHMGPRKVIDALDWLADQGYIVEHGRSDRRVRSLTLAWELQPKRAA